MGLIRLDKYLADMKTGTRSQVKEYIRKKRVRVDGNIICTPEFKLEPAAHTVTFDGQPVCYVSMEYYMLNKPAGVLSAVHDRHDTTVVDLIDAARKDLFPVGRLDKDTEGLLLVTNDGALAHDLLAPGKHVDKTYYAVVAGMVDENTIQAFSAGLYVDDSLTAMPAKLEICRRPEKTQEGVLCSFVYITIQEGKFHQIKRMFAAAGKEVRYLKRLSMGPLALDEQLAPGAYRPLTSTEIEHLKEATRKRSK